MSAATPTASTPDVISPTNASSQDASQLATGLDRMVLDYLRSRGHQRAEKALQESIDAPEDKGKQAEPSTITSEELVRRLTVFSEKTSQPGENALKNTASILQELASVGSMGSSSNIQNLIASIGPGGAEEILSLDPTDKQEGFRELESWVDGSLDMYRVRVLSSSLLKLFTLFAARISTNPLPNILPFLS